MACDHAATRASFAAFFGATKPIGGQDLGDGQWALLGTCIACDTTLAIQIAEPRGTAVHGEIEVPPRRLVHAFMSRKEPLCEHDYTMFEAHETVVSTDSPEVNCPTCISIRDMNARTRAVPGQDVICPGSGDSGPRDVATQELGSIPAGAQDEDDWRNEGRIR